MKLVYVTLLAVLTLPVAPAFGQAGKPIANGIPAAPMPAPLIEGKRAFISYLFTETADATVSGEPQRDYNEFYAAMKQWGRYDLVNDPKDADLIFSIRFNVAFNTLNAEAKDRNGISLWGFRMEIGAGFRQKTRDALFSEAILKLVANIKQLVELNTPQKQ